MYNMRLYSFTFNETLKLTCTGIGTSSHVYFKNDELKLLDTAARSGRLSWFPFSCKCSQIIFDCVIAWSFRVSFVAVKTSLLSDDIYRVY